MQRDNFDERFKMKAKMGKYLNENNIIQYISNNSPSVNLFYNVCY